MPRPRGKIVMLAHIRVDGVSAMGLGHRGSAAARWEYVKGFGSVRLNGHIHQDAGRSKGNVTLIPRAPMTALRPSRRRGAAPHTDDECRGQQASQHARRCQHQLQKQTASAGLIDTPRKVKKE